MAMPYGKSSDVLEEGGGYLLRSPTSPLTVPEQPWHPDPISLARWWRAFCAGEIVAERSLTDMSTFDQGDGSGSQPR